MAWARVVRGIDSIANAMTPRAASLSIPSGSLSGARNPIRTVPGSSSATSSAVGRPTRTTAPAPAIASACETSSAPAAAYSASANPAARPASRSTAKLKPDEASFATASGTSATRRSPAPVSFGTATLTEMALYEARRREGREPAPALEDPSTVGSLLATFSAALEARDPYLRGHSARVTSIAEGLARKLGWRGERLDALHLGGSLHDVGKIAVNASVLRKPGPLTDEELAQIKRHPVAGAR